MDLEFIVGTMFREHAEWTQSKYIYSEYTSSKLWVYSEQVWNTPKDWKIMVQSQPQTRAVFDQHGGGGQHPHRVGVLKLMKFPLCTLFDRSVLYGCLASWKSANLRAPDYDLNYEQTS